jgi:chemotaxis protein MotB
MRTSSLVVMVGLVGVALAAGCGVKKETHQKCLDTLKATQAELDETKRVLDVSKDTVAKLEGELTATRSDRDKKTAAALEKEKRINALLAEMADNKRDVEAELLKLRRTAEQAEKRLAAYRKLQERLRQLVDTGKLEVAFRHGQMILKLPSSVLFASGKAKLSKQGKVALNEVLQILLEFKDRRFQIGGHTDNVPIRSRKFRNNWQLSTARAVSVVEAMVDAGFDPTHLAAAGFGEHYPVVPNDSPENRAQNRRIEIILIPDLSELDNLATEAPGDS